MREGGCFVYEPSAVAWHNGVIVPREASAPSVASPSLHLGIGVFDGIRAYWNRDHHYAHELNAHVRRFKDNSERLGLGFQWTEAELIDGCWRLLASLAPEDLYLRPIAFRPQPLISVTASRGLPMDVVIFAVRAPRDLQRAVSLHVSTIERVSGSAVPVTSKATGVYLNSYVARRQAEECGFDDALMLDRLGRITEASAANVFFLRGQSIVTPALTPDIFPGITRETVLRIAREMGCAVEEGALTIADIERFDGAFLASTLMEVCPVSRIG